MDNPRCSRLPDPILPVPDPAVTVGFLDEKNPTMRTPRRHSRSCISGSTDGWHLPFLELEAR